MVGIKRNNRTDSNFTQKMTSLRCMPQQLNKFLHLITLHSLISPLYQDPHSPINRSRLLKVEFQLMGHFSCFAFVGNLLAESW